MQSCYNHHVNSAISGTITSWRCRTALQRYVQMHMLNPSSLVGSESPPIHRSN